MRLILRILSDAKTLTINYISLGDDIIIFFSNAAHVVAHSLQQSTRSRSILAKPMHCGPWNISLGLLTAITPSITLAGFTRLQYYIKTYCQAPNFHIIGISCI
mgnify:FL=1